MSKEHCTIKCTHGKGLACRICYDQTFGADWHRNQRKAANRTGDKGATNGAR